MLKPTREKHCFYAKLCENKGHCIANCHYIELVKPGITEDCIGKRSETTQEYMARTKENQKLH